MLRSQLYNKPFRTAMIVHSSLYSVWTQTSILWSSWQRELDNLRRHLQEDCPINKERGNFSAIPLETLKKLLKNKKQVTIL